LWSKGYMFRLYLTHLQASYIHLTNIHIEMCAGIHFNMYESSMHRACPILSSVDCPAVHFFYIIS
jgi:hypothetical protein